MNSINYNYDSSVRLTYTISRSDKISFDYDFQGNLISKTYEGSINGIYEIREVSSAYEAFSNIQGIGNWYYQQWDGTEYTDLTLGRK